MTTQLVWAPPAMLFLCTLLTVLMVRDFCSSCGAVHVTADFEAFYLTDKSEKAVEGATVTLQVPTGSDGTVRDAECALLRQN